MKNKPLLTRSGTSPLVSHKLDDQRRGFESTSSAPADLQPFIKPSLHQPVMFAPDPDGSRYTLSLKIEKSVADIIARLCGSPDLGVQAGAKRSLTMLFRAHLLDTPIESSSIVKLRDPVSLRLDIRLPEALVSQILSAEQALPLEPRATTLARYISPKLASFTANHVLRPNT